jgi:hypothetical protein
MSDTRPHQQMAELFRKAKSAHHQAFIEVDGADPDWPLWYAHYVQADLNRIAAAELTVSELTYYILAAEKARQHENPAADWPEFYSQFLLADLGR